MIENILYVLTEECPLILPRNALHNVHDAYDKWIESNDKTCNYLLELMINMISIQYERIEIAREIMRSFELMFNIELDKKRHEAVKYRINA